MSSFVLPSFFHVKTILGNLHRILFIGLDLVDMLVSLCLMDNRFRIEIRDNVPVPC